jgi:hypothetical protein
MLFSTIAIIQELQGFCYDKNFRFYLSDYKNILIFVVDV